MKKKKKILLMLVVVFALSLGGGYGKSLIMANDPLQPQIAKKVLRFHVRAASDDPADQKRKLKVRDSVGTYIKTRINYSENIDETKEALGDCLREIERVAEKTLREAGSSDTVEARISDTYFPEKTYGKYTFPAGVYQALEIIIGEGRGHNWWCVLYPNMCFGGTVYETPSDESGEKLREVLSPGEYRDVVEEGDYEVRFKFFDLF